MKYRSIAVLAAITLLCGCSGNTGTSTGPETLQAPTEEISVPQQTAETSSSAPAGMTGTGSDPGSQPEDDTEPGVDLIAGKWSELDNMFKLNGTWCEPEELPLEKTDYYLPEKWWDNDCYYSFGSGTLFLTVQEPNNTKYANTSPAELWYIDLANGDERLVYQSGENEHIAYTGEKYFAIERTADDDAHEIYIGSALDNDPLTEWLYKLPENNGNITLVPDLGIYEVDDTMYIGGMYELTEFDQTLDAIYTLDLATGELELFGVNMSQLQYGSADLCWFEGDTMKNLLDETAARVLYAGDKVVSSNMQESYYTTSEIRTYNDILGYRYALYWTDHRPDHNYKNEAQHYLGKTGYSFDASSLHLTKDCIFAMWLGKQDMTHNNLVLGIYDTDNNTARAAMISFPEEDFIYSENEHNYTSIISDNEAIYIMQPHDNKITMYRTGENS